MRERSNYEDHQESMAAEAHKAWDGPTQQEMRLEDMMEDVRMDMRFEERGERDDEEDE